MERVIERGAALDVHKKSVTACVRVPGPAGERRQMLAKQAPKRIGLRFHPTRIVTWDHRKLGGAY